MQWLAVLAACFNAAAVHAAALPDVIPPFLSQGVSPNLVLTIDDSASMVLGDASNLEQPVGTDKAGMSAYWSSPDVNELYFDPGKTYDPGIKADGHWYPSLTDATKVPRYPYGIYNDNAAGCPEEIDLTNRDAFKPVVGDYVYTRCQLREVSLKLESHPAYSGDAPPAPYYHEFKPDIFYCENDEGYEVCDADEDGSRSCEVWHGPSGDDQTPDKCFERHTVSADQMENFANWYAYYRTRLLMVQTVISHVMLNLDDEVRLTYQGLEAQFDLQPEDAAFRSLVDRFSPYSQNRTDFYGWLYGLSAINQTYLTAAQIRVGEFATRGVSRADDIDAHKGAFGGDESGAHDPPEAQACGVPCRQNFHLMLTDGFWEDTWGEVGKTKRWPKTRTDTEGTWIAENQDGKQHDLHGGRFGVTSYVPSSTYTQLYSDDNIGMLADAAFYYWVRDLDDDPSNDAVPPMFGDPSADGTEVFDEENFWNPNNDPAHWQHLTLFTVGLGVEGAVALLDPPEFGEYALRDESTTRRANLREDGFPECTQDPPYKLDKKPPSSCSAINDGKRSWPSDSFPDKAKIDDLFHAGINGRGGYFDASSPGDLTKSLVNILNVVSSAVESEAANASVAIDGGGLSDLSRVYQAVTDTETWSGTVRSLRLSTGKGGNCPEISRGEFCEETDDPYQSTDETDAFLEPRTIFTSANGVPKDFTTGVFGDLSLAQKRALIGCLLADDQGGYCADPPGSGSADEEEDPEASVLADQEALAKARISWLRSDDHSGNVPVPTEFRERDSFLGDVLGSGPIVVGNPRQVFRDPDYRTFRSDTDRKTVVYVGANDGMLHAFDAGSTEPKLDELFAYVPEAVYTDLADLTDDAYGGGNPPKNAYVDGPLSYSDAKFISARGEGDWHTVLVGAFGMGAQGIYALDVTDPEASLADDIVLWEFTDASGSDDLDADDRLRDGREMGYSLSTPVIVRIDDDDSATTEPTWVVLVGNGFGSTSQLEEDSDACCTGPDCSAEALAANCTFSNSGNAVLYVLKVGGTDGERIIEVLDTGVGKDTAPDAGGPPENSGLANGLMQVSAMDTDGDLVADRAYAGDLFGNVYRFELKGLSTTVRRVFQATDVNGDPQPITTRIAFTDHPNGGYMLLFGTGKFVSSIDKGDDQIQTFYGVWDDGGILAASDPDTTGTAGRGNLLVHEFEAFAEMTDDNGQLVSVGRTSSKNPGQKTSPTGSVRGWRIDLGLPEDWLTVDCVGSERVVVDPQVRHGRVVFVSTIPEGECSAGGKSWINALDALTGARLDFSPFDFNLDGGFDDRDLLTVSDTEGRASVKVGSSIRVVKGNANSGSGIYSAPSILGLGGGQVMSIVSDSEGDLIQLEESGGFGWRTWRQLE